MLLADEPWALRRVQYEVEEFMAKYPHSPDARLLKDRIYTAVFHAKSARRGRDSAADYTLHDSGPLERRRGFRENKRWIEIYLLALGLLILIALINWLFL